MKPKLLIVGAGGHGLVVADAALELGLWSEIVFLDDHVKGDLLIPNCKVLGVIADVENIIHKYQDIFVAIGDNKRRLALINEFMEKDFNIPIIMHPTSSVSSNAKIGLGSFIAANSVVGVGAKLGKGCIVNTGASVDHENLLADGVHVSPGAHLGGGVQIGKCSWIGIGASVREQASIGEEPLVGPRAPVINNVKDNQQMLGVPARAKGL